MDEADAARRRRSLSPWRRRRRSSWTGADDNMNCSEGRKNRRRTFRKGPFHRCHIKDTTVNIFNTDQSKTKDYASTFEMSCDSRKPARNNEEIYSQNSLCA